MRLLVGLVVVFTVASGCSAPGVDHDATASAIGVELAGRLIEPLSQSAGGGVDPESDLIGESVATALQEIELPSDILRLVRGSHLSSGSGGGRADVSFSVVVVPKETEVMFCMVFAISNRRELVAEPAAGDPLNRCDDTELVGLSQP